jgi:hypothetical protein
MRLPSPSKSKSELSGQSGHALPDCYQRFVPILLQKSLMLSGNSDSVSVMRFAVEASHDGTAQSRSRAVVLFIST